jgi:CcmD family protein
VNIESFNQGFITAAYGISWTVILGYLLYISRRSARAHADYDRIVQDTKVKS